MFFKNFRIRIILRIVFLFVTIYGVVYFLDSSSFYATAVILLLACILQVFGLIRVMDKSNEQMSQFLEAIRYADFSQSFKKTGSGKSFDILQNAFSEVMQDFQQIRREKEEQYRYLQTVVQHVGVGLIAFDNDGVIELYNTAAKKLLGIPRLRNINGLEMLSKELLGKITGLKSGRRELIKIRSEDDLLQLAAFATEFQLRGRSLKLISLHNIQSELEEQEMEAWQKLIRVLTHEIMNSITPITSLAKTVDQSLAEMTGRLQDQSDLKDIHDAVSTIHKRSEGLLHFVESYRKLTRIPRPDFQIITIEEVFWRVSQLVKHESNAKKITISSIVQPANLKVLADQELIEQVLLNLMRNAFDALADTRVPLITLSAELDHKGRVLIKVSDNGSGIVPEALEKIFIPFFTTKKTGSGIGLSLSRQIMRQHAGSINVMSEPDVGTTFKLIFP